MRPINPEQLEALIKQQLDVFYNRRIQTLSNLDLWKTLQRKNPYPFRAIGMQNGSEIVKQLLQVYISASDEGIFGDAFFEPIVKAIRKGVEANEVGMDIVIETPDTYKVVQIQSDPNWGNADQKRKLYDNFKEARERFIGKQVKKQFVALLGQCYGRGVSEPNDRRVYATRSGQAFWEELTGDPDFHLQLIRLMKDYLTKHRPDYQNAWNKAVNRFTREFLKHFGTEDGEINWEKITQLNSGESPPTKSRKKSV